MASNQELQNALMLKKANPNLTTAQAVNQSRVPVTATSQINQDQLAKNQASRQTQPLVQSLTPEQTQQISTPVANSQVIPGQNPNETRPLPTEQQINAQYGGVIQPNGINSVQPINAPTEMPAQKVETVKAPTIKPTEAPIDYTQAKGRESEITANLDSFKAKGMTPDEIMRASDYQNASPEKKALIEPYLKQTVPTASAMYNNIVAKADIPDEMKLTPSYKIAQNRYTKANMFSNMTPSQLANEMKNVKLVEGSQTYEDLKAMNPKLVQDATNLRKVNGGTSNIWTYTNNPDGTPVKKNNLEQTFADDFNDNFGEFIKKMYAIQTPEQIRAIIYTPDVQQAEEKAKSIELDINKLDDALDMVDKDVESELAGSGATGSRIALEKSIRKDAINKQKDSLERNYTTYANKANNLITQNTSVFQTQQQQQQAQNAAMLPFITDQYKTAQAKAQAELALNDPATQIQATMDEFAKLGIVAQGNTASKIAEFKKSGLSLPDYITKLRGQFMSKPEYQQILAQQKGKGISYQTIGDKVYRQNADGSLTETAMNPNKAPDAKSPEWKQDKNGNWYNANSSTSPAVQTSELSPTAISQISTRLQGNNVQCGMVTNDYNSKYFPDAPRMGDSYESKIATVNAIGVAPVPQVGGNFVMDTGTSTGHTGIVTSVDLANGTFTATDANKNGSKNGGPVQTSTYKISPKVTFSNAPVGQVASKVTPLTQVAIQTKSLSGTPSEQSKQLEELQKLGVLDKGEGNANLYKAKVDVKQEMPNLITGYDAFERAKAIIDKHKQKGDLDEMLGSYDANQERLKAKTGAFTDTEFQNDFNTLDQVFGKELSQYMNKISGATVGDKEVERLKRQVPNLDMSESEFDTALSAYEDSLKNANRFFLNEYGFTDMDTARKVLLGNGTAQSNTAPVNVQSIIDEWNNR